MANIIVSFHLHGAPTGNGAHCSISRIFGWQCDWDSILVLAEVKVMLEIKEANVIVCAGGRIIGVHLEIHDSGVLFLAYNCGGVFEQFPLFLSC